MTNGDASLQGGNGKRLKGMMRAVLLFAVILLLWGGWRLLVGQYAESTDNAYVHGDLVTVESQVAGTVTAVLVDETAFVRQGETLVRLGTVDADIALDRAVANLGMTVRRASERRQKALRLGAAVALKEADREQAERERTRRADLWEQKAVSEEEYQQAGADVVMARAALALAKAEKGEIDALAPSTPIPDQPEVREAAAAVKQAWVVKARSAIVAPVDGYVARLSAQVGESVAPGKPLMALVAADRLWVEANFKEGQLAHIRPGQKATVTADLYGSSVTFPAKVAGVSAGAGSVFSLLPAQNATGNWIKVVQRVPVRIVFDGPLDPAHPLALGISMQVTVHTDNREGALLSRAPSTGAPRSTDVYRRQIDGVDELIDRTIRESLSPVSGEKEG
ncbi:MAG: HlyD family efflux transporter periplasmic adaptor subunit [Nitrospinae bacterium]|nr:HlyD family efflux transporter periplasmic adaptor subunit [Nitrospinota bacterium]